MQTFEKWDKKEGSKKISADADMWPYAKIEREMAWDAAMEAAKEDSYKVEKKAEGYFIPEELLKLNGISAAEGQDLVRLYRWQAESLKAFRDKLGVESNLQALDKIDEINIFVKDIEKLIDKAEKILK